MGNFGVCENCHAGKHEQCDKGSMAFCTCECNFMQIVTDEHGFVHASFSSYHNAGREFYYDFALPKLDVEKRAKYKMHGDPVEYPYYYIWTWDHKDSRNESKWKVQIMSENEVNDYLKKFKRDTELEQSENWDDQYFYLGVVHRDGVSYALRQELGMPTGIGTTERLSLLCDHHHMDWDSIVWFRGVGVRYATSDRAERRKMRKDKRKRKLVEKLRRAYVKGTITERGKKILRNKGWLKPTSLPYIDPSVAR